MRNRERNNRTFGSMRNKHRQTPGLLGRRRFLHLAAVAAALPALARAASAQAYPSRPVRIIVGLPAGGGADIVARLVGQALSQRLGRQFIVEDRPGAGSSLATEDVVKAPPDGYTLLLAMPSNTVNATLRPDADFNFVRDIAPVAMICTLPFVLLANPSTPAKSVPELIAYAKANPGKLNYGSRGIGTLTHVIAELFKMMAGVDLAHVPYRDNFLPDLLSGNVQLGFFAEADTLDFIKAGELRALAVTGADRLAELPDVPAMAEFLPGYEASGWLGVGAPKGTSADIVERLNEEIDAVVADDDMKARLTAAGFVPAPMTVGEFSAFIAADIDKWAKVLRTAGIKAE
jgi:tripartite-type tricarboxylate transporter receptor subunit TctC